MQKNSPCLWFDDQIDALLQMDKLHIATLKQAYAQG